MDLKVLVKAGAHKERVIEDEGVLCVSVREPANANAANKRVRTLVALYKHVPETEVRCVSGHRSRRKVFSVRTR